MRGVEELSVIPGPRESEEPGIHNHRRREGAPQPRCSLRGYGFRARGLTPAPRNDETPYTSFTFFSGKLRTGLPVAAWIALTTAGATTQMVGSPTPPQKS